MPHLHRDMYDVAILILAIVMAIVGVATLSLSTKKLFSATGIVIIVLAFVLVVVLIVDSRSSGRSTDSAQPQPSSVVAHPEPQRVEPSRLHTVRGITYAEIPAGTITLGCGGSDADCDTDDLASHGFTASRPFLLMTTEVSWLQYRKCVADSACRDNSALLPEEVRTADYQPVTLVTAADANAFCRWADARLPTEDEWEYAARAGDGRSRFLWPEDERPASVRFGQPLADGPESVSSGPPNSFGLYAMTTNVAEWCASAAGGGEVVVRGGSFNSDLAALRFAARSPSDLTRMAENIGFRCAADISAISEDAR